MENLEVTLGEERAFREAVAWRWYRPRKEKLVSWWSIANIIRFRYALRNRCLLLHMERRNHIYIGHNPTARPVRFRTFSISNALRERYLDDFGVIFGRFVKVIIAILIFLFVPLVTLLGVFLHWLQMWEISPATPRPEVLHTRTQ
jgi:hypothetical protein